MGWESSEMVRFGLGSLVQGQKSTAKLKSAYNSLIIIQWAGNLLMRTDLSSIPSFKVKRWFTGFSELSFRRI